MNQCKMIMVVVEYHHIIPHVCRSAGVAFRKEQFRQSWSRRSWWWFVHKPKISLKPNQFGSQTCCLEVFCLTLSISFMFLWDLSQYVYISTTRDCFLSYGSIDNTLGLDNFMLV
ncbi:hypothetical protein L2E82_34396 [Cichorium intybus]|uniref:Uncharacterized protein n=1 Tax=Cichorium intybus TaxID=13427 RepID=A0ACB9BMD5_CICIN|nr:hypothetical protein L2E82_34396 [Cichorium intybus]